jgi:hypothetical protein
MDRPYEHEFADTEDIAGDQRVAEAAASLNSGRGQQKPAKRTDAEADELYRQFL